MAKSSITHAIVISNRWRFQEGLITIKIFLIFTSRMKVSIFMMEPRRYWKFGIIQTTFFSSKYKNIHTEILSEYSRIQAQKLFRNYSSNSSTTASTSWRACWIQLTFYMLTLDGKNFYSMKKSFIYCLLQWILFFEMSWVYKIY